MKQQISYVHISCIAVIVICYVLSETLLKSNADAAKAVVGIATFLYGKLAFIPAGPVVEKIVRRMPQEEVIRIQSMSPPPPSDDVG